MKKKESILSLLSLWRECICGETDVEKCITRVSDSEFIISVKFSCETQPPNIKYYFLHQGIINNDSNINNAEFDTIEEAENYLIEFLKNAIITECSHQISTPSEEQLWMKKPVSYWHAIRTQLTTLGV